MNANKVMAVLSLLVAGSIRNVAEGFPSWVPHEACRYLFPDPTAHGALPQVLAPPFVVTLSALNNGSRTEYEPGQTYTLTFQTAVRHGEFQGVFIQGRVVADDSVAGTFTVTDPLTRYSNCIPANSGVTHNSPVIKESITTEWTAPPAGTGPVSFGFGVVIMQRIYWGNQRSPVIYERATVATTTESVTTESVTTTDVPVTTQAPMTTAPATMTALAGLFTLLVVIPLVLVVAVCVGLLIYGYRHPTSSLGLFMIKHRPKARSLNKFKASYGATLNEDI